jgi:hypothetical protein
MERDEWLALCGHVEGIVRGHDEAYIGRSCNPDRRLVDHMMKWDAQRLHRVGKGRVRDEIEALETALIKAMDRFARLRNEVIDSPGHYRDGLNYIYVAVRSPR